MLSFVDANVFIRLFSGDDEMQAAAAERLFRRAAAGEIELVTGPPVFFEIAWVLGYRYKLKNEEIISVIEAIVAFPGLTVTDKKSVLRAAALARAADSGFADAYIAAAAEEAGAENIATFNKKHFAQLGKDTADGL
ncbi:PIN domain-containing protein [Synergistes jonesii]|uniref:PIN domain-containing protein n=1 Tax=Synergistes jonesii TaxID=2754 RepID=UPI00248F2799|nr:PIN domain-containing protein [Synergistes jonesii]